MTIGDRFLSELEDGFLVGDGAVGTELFARGVEPEHGVERMNLLAPDLVEQLHRDYVAAGSRIIETNTFGANLPNLEKYGSSEREARETILAGVRLARRAAGQNVYVAGSIGPLPNPEGEPLPPDDQKTIFAALISALIEGGVDVLIFESFASLDELTRAVTVAQSLTELPIVAEMAFSREVKTSDGADAEEVARRCIECGADVVGSNCGYGVLSVTKAAERMVGCAGKVSAYLNAGFPERVEGRLLYLPHQDYIVQAALKLVRDGVRIIGGCCGTNPEIIRLIAETVSNREALVPSARPAAKVSEVAVPPAHIEPTQFPVGSVLVELDAPRSLDVSQLIAAARAVKDAGATAVTVADNPLASVRMDSLTVGGIIQRECGIPVVPHLTGRDRNRLAIQSAIMGAHAVGIRSLVCITGDPVRMCQEPNTSGVFDLTSVGLVQIVNEFNHGHRLSSDCRTAFSIGVAVNPNVRTLSGQVDKLRRKMEAGAHFAMTQPVFEESRIDLLLQALDDGGVEMPIYVGIMPLVSARSAEFLHNEVPGMFIPESTRKRMAEYTDPDDQRAVGLEIALELVDRLAGRAHGFYFVSPRNKAELVTPLIEAGKLGSREAGKLGSGYDRARDASRPQKNDEDLQSG